MYATCLFCNSRLGRNESIEAFPVGRRIAFDAAQGRLWVVCRACERWNLSPLEERWEAIEACERLFHDTRVRVSTEHIGLARLRDGLELVRIGRPLRPEFAAWRYGDQFGKRRVRNLTLAGAGVAATGLFFLGGALSGGIISGWLLWKLSAASIRGDPEKVVARVPVGVSTFKIKRKQLDRVVLLPQGVDQIALQLPVGKHRQQIEVFGPEALRAAGLLLPPANRFGGNRQQVQAAVREIERSSQPQRYLHDVALRNSAAPQGITALPATVRLALEMAAHEETERRALEGELAELERAWQDAEEIAAISDSLLLPGSVRRAFDRLRGS
ncbi:MAG TPA: hypothetical protein VK939_08895 [Longimicrobiales bacterium]|nr:hypothetical protein [Longimicrobiales bacterium]